MRVSLGLRVLTLVGTINLAVFGAGLYFLSDTLESVRQAEQELQASKVRANLSKWISDSGDLRVAQILKWPVWDEVTDAVIMDRNENGVSLNPLGAMNRTIFFDREAIERDLIRASDTESQIESQGGLASPVLNSMGNPWGGCWIKTVPDAGALPMWLRLLPWFVASTFLLFFGTFGVLHRYVLTPVGALARGVRKIRNSNFDEPVQAPRHHDQLTDLIDTFNQMASDVHGFNEYLEHEADAAKEQAFLAEAAALRQRRLAAMGELAAGIAHEINNPLGGMLNAVEVLDRDSIDPNKRRRYHELLRGGLERIQGTVSKLLRFTPREGELNPVDLHGPVKDAIDLISHRAQQQKVSLRFHHPSLPILVMAQPSDMGQVMLNLLVNSLDAIESHDCAPDANGMRGSIDVRLAEVDDRCVVSVIDDGPGVPDDQLERAADLFYTTKEVGRGTGLGLALVHTVVAQHGGTVQMSNRQTDDGRRCGLRVDLHFPRASTAQGLA